MIKFTVPGTPVSKLRHRTAWKRLMSKVEKSERCWEWIGAFTGKGDWPYGSFYLEGRCIAAHRAAWIIRKGEIPEGMKVLHKCDNTRCIRPSHLFLGTSADNSKDMVNKHRSLAGMKHHKAKLTDAQVLEIRQSTQSSYVLAPVYGVSSKTIRCVKRKSSWRHL